MCTRRYRWLIPVLAVAVLTACYDRPGQAFYQPGEYRGRTDPLLAKEASPAQQQALLQRLKLVQTDR